jgi:NAD+ synthase
VFELNKTPDILKLDIDKEIERISDFLTSYVNKWRKDGVVVGLSGGVDSAVVSELLVNSFGSEKVKGLILPEKESNPISKKLGIKQAEKLGIDYEVFDITAVLEAFGTYKLRDEAVREVIPDYSEECKIKLLLPEGLLEKYSFNVFSLRVKYPNGKEEEKRLPKKILNRIIAATDTKQRTRMMALYYHGESSHRLVVGTTNRPETIQGFFVRYGDGGVDIEPIAHLYKTQVYQLAEHFGVVRGIIERDPSPDTFSFPVSDEEFFFRIPYEIVDQVLYCWERNMGSEDASSLIGLNKEQVERVYRDISSKFEATKYLRELPPSLLDREK